eukprot:TRINITY_DN11152_c2_g1_i1.p2 TRINITY_DN11152_c2_g1~~TRINITY_DN11152_c2_g1_i1.p2  ORF type:complete len:135 (+),score=0.21 TRINITY_DN11152_c2_g1_i1:222-626(+)
MLIQVDEYASLLVRQTTVAQIKQIIDPKIPFFANDYEEEKIWNFKQTAKQCNRQTNNKNIYVYVTATQVTIKQSKLFQSQVKNATSETYIQKSSHTVNYFNKPDQKMKHMLHVVQFLSMIFELLHFHCKILHLQ